MASSSPAAAAMTTAAPIPKEVMDAIMRAHFFHGHLPSQAAAIAVLVLYLVASAAVLLPTVQTRAWFMLTVVVTGGLEAAGYAFRLMMLTRTPSLMLYAQMVRMVGRRGWGWGGEGASDRGVHSHLALLFPPLASHN